jgi:MoxR-like ATPase
MLNPQLLDCAPDDRAPMDRQIIQLNTEESVPETEQAQYIEAATPMEHVLFEMKKVIVGQEYLLERVMVALLARGHVLIEGVPGLAKTLTIRTLAETISGEFRRIQFTPDLVPADLIGTRVYNQGSGTFSTELGPVFTNLLLADEINRAPAKVQSALLEVMQERQVTIGHESHPVPNPFLVLATQNPIETEGTYALPEAQVDRFLLKILVGYPTAQEELTIVQRVTGTPMRARPILSTTELINLQQQADAVYVDPEIMAYAVRLVTATRTPAEFGLHEIARYISFGASPRASINLVLSARAIALLRARDYVLPGDIADLAADVLRHRLVLTYEAYSDGVTPDKLVASVLAKIERPARPLQGPADPSQTWARQHAFSN